MCIVFFKRFIHFVLKYSSPVIKRRIFPIGSMAAICCWLVFLLPAVSTPVFSQWVKHGPGPNTGGGVENIKDGEVVGAIHAVAPHPTDENILYVGAVNGGIWKTINAMAESPTWVQLTDFHESLSIGALEFDPTDGTNRTLAAGIGRFSSMGRVGGKLTGLLRTTDGGANWAPIDGGGTLHGFNISGVAPRGTTIVISVNIVFGGILQGTALNHGIWRSTDTGGTWKHISGGDGTGLPAGKSYDLTGDPNDPGRLFTNAGTKGIYRSTDMGETWDKVSNADMDDLITANTKNIEIAVGTSNNVYVAIVNDFGEEVCRLAGLFRSGNGGKTWKKLDLPTTVEKDDIPFGIHPGGQGEVHLSIAADPTDPNIVYVGGDCQPAFNEGITGDPFAIIKAFSNSIGANDYSGRLFRVDASQPAGSQAVHLTHSNALGPAGGGTASGSAPHADSRDMAFAYNGDLIEVDDGGVYRRTSPQKNTGDWFSMNGDIQVTEFHDIAWDANFKIIIGGAQDTGTPEQLLPANLRWKAVSNGDGGDVAVDDTGTPGLSVRYSSSQYLGGFQRRVYNTTNEWLYQVSPKLTVVDGGNPLEEQFSTPIQLNRAEPTRLIIGGKNSVYESLDQGDTITEIGPAIRVNSWGKDPIAYGADENPDILYVGSGSQVYVRTAAHPARLEKSESYPGERVVAIAIDPDDPNTAYVIDYKDIFQTRTAGKGEWKNITGNLQDLSPGGLWSIAYITANTDGSVAVGGNSGVFKAPGPDFNTWTRLGTDFPNALVYDLEYDAADKILVAGTLGRGAWTYNLAEREPVDVMLIMDLSDSMGNPACPGCDPKIDVLKDAVELFIRLWTAVTVPDDRIGAVYFKSDVSNFNKDSTVMLSVPDHAGAVISDVQSKTQSGSTAMGGGLQFAIDNLIPTKRPRSIILFTDGKQNRNPMVLKIDDSPGEFHLEINNEPGRKNSNIDPKTPTPTQLDENLKIKVSTIGVGATSSWKELLRDIAYKTGGRPKTTNAPDEDLRRFYVEQLIDVLRDYSPQLIDYRRKTVTKTSFTESFSVNHGARQVILKLSWKRGNKFSFQVEKDGVNVTKFGKFINGDFYKIFAIKLPANVRGNPVTSVGVWKMKIRGQQGVTYEAACICDERQLKYHFSIGDNYAAGNTMKLEVKLNLGYNPLTDARKVTAIIKKPGVGSGTLLSTLPMLPQPAGYQPEGGSTEAQEKLHLLLLDKRYYQEFQPTSHIITLANNGDGTYTADYPGLDKSGTYTVIFTVEGEHPHTGEYHRTETLSTEVSIGRVWLDDSIIKARQLRVSQDGRIMELLVLPRDKQGNYLGPDYGHAITVKLSKGTVGSQKKDNLDGSYTILLVVPPGEDPEITVTVKGCLMYKGRLSRVETGKTSRFGLGIHGGTTFPTGNFNTIYDSSFMFGINLDYHITPQVSLVVFPGYNRFKAASPLGDDTHILNISGNLKYEFNTTNLRPYVIAGGGLYIPKSGNAKPGINFGLGIDFQLNPQLIVELGRNYHHIFTCGTPTGFAVTHGGLIFRF